MGPPRVWEVVDLKDRLTGTLVYATFVRCEGDEWVYFDHAHEVEIDLKPHELDVLYQRTPRLAWDQYIKDKINDVAMLVERVKQGEEDENELANGLLYFEGCIRDAIEQRTVQAVSQQEDEART